MRIRLGAADDLAPIVEIRNFYVANTTITFDDAPQTLDERRAWLEDEDVHRAVAGIALPNEASVRLHRRMGFNEVGVFDEYAIKGDRYLSSLWMQRPL